MPDSLQRQQPLPPLENSQLESLASLVPRMVDAPMEANSARSAAFLEFTKNAATAALILGIMYFLATI